MKINMFGGNKEVSPKKMPNLKNSGKAVSLPKDSVGKKEQTGDGKMKKLADMAKGAAKKAKNAYGDNWLGPMVDVGITTAIGLGAGAVGGAMLATGAAAFLCGTAGAIVGGAVGVGLGMAWVNHKFHS